MRRRNLHEQEVAEVVDAERHLEAVVREAGLGVGRQVDRLRVPGRSTTGWVAAGWAAAGWAAAGWQRLGGVAVVRRWQAHRVAHEPIEAALSKRALEVFCQVLDRLERGELQLDSRVVGGRHARLLCGRLHLGRVAHRRDDVVILARGRSDTGRR